MAQTKEGAVKVFPTGVGMNRYMIPEWAHYLRYQCKQAGTPFFMKKMSNKEPIPDDLMIREYPE